MNADGDLMAQHMERVRERFGDRGVVELVTTIAAYDESTLEEFRTVGQPSPPVRKKSGSQAANRLSKMQPKTIGARYATGLDFPNLE